MTDTLQPYPEYKDSGLPWLGHVPRHWPVRRIKAVLRETDHRSADGSGTLLSLTRVRGLIPHKDMTDKEHSANTLAGYKCYCPGQIVMNRMQAWSGMFGAGSIDGLVSPDYAVFDIIGGHDIKFVLERIKAPDLVGQFALESKGIGSGFNRLYTDRLGPISISLPPPGEQAAIVRFLDHANSRIERAIRAKRKIITLLNEQKQAIIASLVTGKCEVRRVKGEGGSDISLFTPRPSHFMKPSGIPWLGDIPTHWEVRRLRTLTHRIEQGVSPLAVGFLAEGDSWGVLKSGCVNRGVFRETEHKQLAKSFQIDPSIVVKVGDVLISRACGSPSLVGSVGKVESLKYRLILSDKTFRAVFCPLVDVDFMVYAMNSRYYRDQVEQAISGAEGMANNLPLSSLRDFIFAIPPRSEASAIAQHLCETLRESTTAISNFEREIALLREFRTRLTADVVTGKLDVRGEKGEERRVKGEGEWEKEDEAEAMETEEGGEDE